MEKSKALSTKALIFPLRESGTTASRVAYRRMWYTPRDSLCPGHLNCIMGIERIHASTLEIDGKVERELSQEVCD